MNKLLTTIERERGAIIRRRDLALKRRREFEWQRKTLREALREAEARLRSAKRAVLVGGPGRLEEEQEAALIRTLTEGPVTEAALADVIMPSPPTAGGCSGTGWRPECGGSPQLKRSFTALSPTWPRWPPPYSKPSTSQG
jgi:hypothetical protein